MATSRRQRILEYIKTRLEAIQIANGFETDLGLTVLLGEVPTFGPDDPSQVLAIHPQEDQILGQQQKVSIMLAVDIDIRLAPDISQPSIIVEKGLRDVKVAMESGDSSFGGLLTPGAGNVEGLVRGTTGPRSDRQSGSEVVGQTITYGCKYAEAWGNPEA